MVSVGPEGELVLAALSDLSEAGFGTGKSGGSVVAEVDEEEGGTVAAVSGLASDLLSFEATGLPLEESLAAASESSKVISGTGRVTMTSSPASLASPPASARTSSRVT